MHFRVLGPLEVVEEGRRLPLGGPRQRALLAFLLLHPNEAVAADRLIEELWGARAPANAANALQVYVSRLRKLLGPERLERHSGGYALQVEPGELDRALFERLLETARVSEPDAAREQLDEALALWRGPALADLAYEEFAQPEIRRLEELRVVAFERRIDIDLALGRDAALVPELEAWVGEHPLRERLWSQLLLALYRAGRQADALAYYRQARVALVDELGIEPGRELQELQRAILRQDEGLALDGATPVVAREAQPDDVEERRKVVTCLCSDVSSSTSVGEALDPEVLRSLLAHYFEQVRAIAEQHGGNVATFTGDSAVVVFGMPAVREDDALRALRAAIDLRVALAELIPDARSAVTTGQAVVGGPLPVTGEAVLAAARLARAAAPGEILVADSTRTLVRDSVVVEPRPPLDLPACRVIAVSEEPVSHSDESALIGRDAELAALRGEFESAVTDATCRLCTIVGAPGIGKSRLAREFASSLAGRGRVVVGQCLAYGEGVTYRPLAEIVRQVVGPELDGLDDVLAEVPDAPFISQRIAAALGKSDSAVTADEILWAFRRLFETLAAERPLVLVVDDVHSAKPALLDVLEYLASSVGAVPMLLLCAARSDLFEARPSWTSPRPNSTVVQLQPLSVPDSEQLVRALIARHGLADADAGAIASVAEGNPLFAEQLAAMRAERGATDDITAVPPTLRALLAARIDRLTSHERTVIERAAVEGRTFHRGTVSDLLPPAARSTVASSLISLIRKELIQPDRSEFEGDDAFRFGHVLIADAAYDAVPKQLRAELHQRFADSLEKRAADRIADYEEIVGYHLERAHRYRNELGLGDEQQEAIAARAVRHLASSGERAYARDDMATAATLLERALALASGLDAHRRVALGLRLASALLDVGRPADAEAAADAAAAAARAAGDRLGELRAALFCGQIAIWTTNDYGALLPLAEGAIPLFDEAGDDEGATEAWRVIAAASERHADAAAAYQRALVHARRLGSRVDEREILGWLEYHLLLGPTPVREILAWAERDSLPLDELEPAVSTARGALLAMDGRFDEARELRALGETRAHELGMRLWMAANAELGWDIDTLAGDYVAAEAVARRGCELYEEARSRVGLGLCSGMLAQSLLAQGRCDEAEHWRDVCEQNSGPDGVVWRYLRAMLLARRGELVEAERLARESVALAEQADSIRLLADASLALAEALEHVDVDKAAAATEQALELYLRKGIVPLAERARALLASRQATGIRG